MILYSALVKSFLLYGAKTMTMLKSDEQKLVAFHMSCQNRILGICGYDFISNAEVVDRTHQENLATQIQRRRPAVFGPVCRLPDTVSAHTALHLSIDACFGRWMLVAYNGSERTDVLQARGSVRLNSTSG